MSMRRRRQERQQDAKRQQPAHDELSPSKKLAKLDRRFGPGLGAQKERAKLAKAMEPKRRRPKK